MATAGFDRFNINRRQAAGQEPMACACHFERGDARRSFNQIRISRGAHADVVRKYHRAIHVVVAVNGIYAVDQRDFQTCFQRQ